MKSAENPTRSMTGVSVSRSGVRPIHVALFTTTFDVSGAERVLAHLALGLAARNYRVSILGLQRRSGALETLLHGTNVVFRSFDVRTQWDPRPLWKLRRFLRDEHVDVLYTFLFHPLVIGRIVGRWAGVPLVLSSQQTMEWERPHEVWLNRVTARWCDCVVAVSHNVQTYLEQKVHIPLEKLTTIYNCVDVAAFTPDQPVLPDRPHVATIGFAARLVPEKDFETLLQAFARLAAERPGVRLRLAGDGPLRDKLQGSIASMGLSDRVELLGQVENMVAFHRSLDVYVQSSHIEGLPCAVLEAMSTARPVVATGVGGNADAVAEGVTGFLVPPRSPELMAERFASLIDDPPLARAMGDRGRERVLELFSAEGMVRNTEELIDRLRHRTLQTGVFM